MGDQMGLSAIDKILLLPIMGIEGAGDGQLRSMKEMFGSDDRFLFGYCLPNDIPDDKVADDVKRAMDSYDIQVLKIHPAVTGIDLSTQKGIARVESILDASRQTRLKVVIHGGRSPDCENVETMSYGTVNDLQHVDWSITSETIIIAHSGCFGHTFGEVQGEVLPMLNRLLRRHSNLAVDTSGVGFEVLCQILKTIDPQRIVFGSDSLYEVQWSVMVKLWCALEQTVSRPEDTLLRIASRNPANLISMAKSYAQQENRRVGGVCQSAGGLGL